MSEQHAAPETITSTGSTDEAPRPGNRRGGLARYVAAAALARTADSEAIVTTVLLVTKARPLRPNSQRSKASTASASAERPTRSAARLRPSASTLIRLPPLFHHADSVPRPPPGHPPVPERRVQGARHRGCAPGRTGRARASDVAEDDVRAEGRDALDRLRVGEVHREVVAVEVQLPGAVRVRGAQKRQEADAVAVPTGPRGPASRCCRTMPRCWRRCPRPRRWARHWHRRAACRRPRRTPSPRRPCPSDRRPPRWRP